MAASLPGEPLQPGRRRTPDEGHFDVIGLARILGRRLNGAEELRVRLWQNELRPTHTRACGVHTLADPDNAEALADKAREAFEWLAERAPAGYRFVWTDAVYLEPDADLGAEVVAVDAVARMAGGADAVDLACAHVRRGAGGWVAGDAVRVLAGPFDRRDEAVGAVERARARLVGQLRAAGREDLAGTASRWPPVPVEPDTWASTPERAVGR
ncbi:hypothetical protein [Pseudonocardia acaciae]|uniref:hypothetical protein n=1 Tax=Pseudonocardia acaciae TaxID=551276 RepID=UPI000686EA60|nr:hypothetical protein [Pseudonocardia acaciae]